MITGELKSKIDRVWDAFWSGGISNPLEVIEQITYLLFIRRLDDIQERMDVASLNGEEWNVLYRLRLQVEQAVSRTSDEAERD